ncbi:Uncharacterised protein [Segatella buccae]|uniref:Uncharacterized protein n=1 Tax=Segatella buccae TaxID=28126 RepID=A0AAQ1UG25_9BACT|nr:Uncharacterised protein [Segatella buccae]
MFTCLDIDFGTVSSSGGAVRFCLVLKHQSRSFTNIIRNIVLAG